MHEGAITKSVIDTVLRALETGGVTGDVIEVHVTIGVAQGIVPESMKMFFDMEKAGTVLERAELLIAVQGMTGWCPACGKEHELDIPVMYCPDCASPLELKKGNEIVITSIEVEE